MTPRGWGLYLSLKHQLWAQSRWLDPCGPWWEGSPRLLSQLCGWQSRGGRERTKTGNNHKAIGCWTQRDGWLSSSCNDQPAGGNFVVTAAPGLMGRQGEKEQELKCWLTVYPKPFPLCQEGSREHHLTCICKRVMPWWVNRVAEVQLPAAVVPWAAAGSTSVAWFFTGFPSQKSRASCLSSDLILTSLSVYYFLF